MRRRLIVLVALVAAGFVGCIIGPKHDDLLTGDEAPADTGALDTSRGVDAPIAPESGADISLAADDGPGEGGEAGDVADAEAGEAGDAADAPDAVDASDAYEAGG